MLASKLLSAAGGTETLWVDEVFSSWLYTGNGSTQTITNGIDLAGKGGLVITKNRSSGAGAGVHPFTWTDTIQGARNVLYSDRTDQTFVGSNYGAYSFLSSGFTLGNSIVDNRSGDPHLSLTFRKAAKFFDCGTYTGNGTTRSIGHALTSAPGFLIVKRTDATGGWIALHRTGFSSSWGFRRLDTTDTFLDVNSYPTYFGNGTSFVAPTATEFTVNVNADLNASGGTYVWYAFAHDTSTDGIIQCGSFTTDGSGNATVNLGWEPQFVLSKRSSLAGTNWQMVDSMRGFTVSSPDPTLEPNTSRAEQADNWATITSTGFEGPFASNSQTYIYLAIRRPNKPPTSGTQVYNAIARTGTGAAATVTGVGFAPDLGITSRRNGTGIYPVFIDRLRGTSTVLGGMSMTGDETSNNGYLTAGEFLFNMDGFALGSGSGTYGYFNYNTYPTSTTSSAAPPVCLMWWLIRVTTH